MEKGVCFGCLKIGHISRDCRSRLICDVCKQNHPEMLHIEQKDRSFKPEQNENGNNVVISSHTCEHIGAGDETTSIAPVQVKSHRKHKQLKNGHGQPTNDETLQSKKPKKEKMPTNSCKTPQTTRFYGHTNGYCAAVPLDFNTHLPTCIPKHWLCPRTSDHRKKKRLKN